MSKGRKFLPCKCINVYFQNYTGPYYEVLMVGENHNTEQCFSNLAGYSNHTQLNHKTVRIGVLMLQWSRVDSFWGETETAYSIITQVVLRLQDQWVASMQSIEARVRLLVFTARLCNLKAENQVTKAD